MTEDKKNPESDEVADEQLDDVAGGATVIPGSAKTGAGGGAIPDVCMTPGGGSAIPTPYPNTGDTGSTEPNKKVKVSGGNEMGGSSGGEAGGN